MSRLGINTGSSPNDGQGDTLRRAMGKINENFVEVYSQFGDGDNLVSYANTSGISSISEGLTGNPYINVSGISNLGVTTTQDLKVTNITAAGIITAVSYRGDGSQLENVVATNSGVETLDNDVRTGVAQELNFRNGITVSAPDGVGRVDIDVTAISEIGDNVITGVLTATDRITVGAATTFTDELVINGNARITGILTIGTGSITLDANARTIQGVDQIKVGQGSSTLVISQNLETGSLQVTDELSGDIKGEVGFGSTSSINTTGIVTASAFYGDGSNLTGIDATALKDSGGNVKIQANTSGAVVTGVLTATSFEGDGSTLENIVPNIAIASSTTADIEIRFEDDFGDGWNGGEVDVYVNDVLVSDNFTIPDDGTGDALSFLSLILNDVSVGSTIKIERVTEGSYPEEMVVNTIRVYGDTTGSLNGLFGTQRYFFGATGIGTTTVTLNVANFQIPPSPTGTLNEVRYNISTQSFELYNGTAWVKTGAGLKIQKDTNLISDLTTFPDNGAGAVNNDNIFLGRNAGCGIATFSSCNIFMGPGAGQSSGKFTCNNNFFGECAGYQASGKHNNFFGQCAGFYNTNSNNNFFGQLAGKSNTTGFYNNFLGYWSGCSNTTGGWNFFVGQLPGSNNTTGSNNTFIGNRAGCSNTTGDGNIYIGRCAGRVLRGNNNIGLGCQALSGFQAFNDPDANDNIGLGFQAGNFVDTGCRNILIGRHAGYGVKDGDNNIALGECSGFGREPTVGVGTNNITIGRYAGKYLGLAYNNIFIGECAGHGQLASIVGGNNLVIGSSAGKCLTNGSGNILMGQQSGFFNTTGSCNNFFGFNAGCNQTSGNNNIAIGYNVQLPNLTGSDQLAIGSGSNHWLVGDENFNIGIGTTNPTTKLQVGSASSPQVIGFGTVQGYAFPSTNVLIGDENTGSSLTPQASFSYLGLNNNFIGAGAGAATTIGVGNNFFGLNAGCSNTRGSYNNFFGLYVGCSNTQGRYNNFFGGYTTGVNNINGWHNNFFGSYAGYYNTNGSYNNFFGRDAGKYNTTGSYNNIMGFDGGYYNTTGRNNNFFGELAGYGNTSGNDNNMFGLFAGVCNTSGSRNNFFGRNVASSNTTGSNNIIIGERAGERNTTGNHNTFLGSFTGISNTASNKIILGRGLDTNFLFDSPDTTKDTQFAVGIRTSTFASKYWLVGDENFNIGIGTTNPSYKLDVDGDINFTGDLYQNGSLFSGGGGGGGESYWVSTSAGIHTLSSVGIGTTNPKVRLQLDGVLGFGTIQGNAFPSTNILIGDENTGPNLTPKVGGDWKGLNNNFIGAGAGAATTTGTGNNFFGLNAGCSNTSGYYNNFFGLYAGRSNTTGNNNNFFGGYATGIANTSGYYNNFFGNSAGRYNTSGNNNNFIGSSAGRNNTTGCGNNFFGSVAGYSNTTGRYNNFIGSLAGYYNTSGRYNNFFGYYAGGCNDTGWHNNFFGYWAGLSNSTGQFNTFIGYRAGEYNTIGCSNHFIGQKAGFYNTVGEYNIFFGAYAGFYSTGSCNIVIGKSAVVPIPSGNNQLTIGIGNSNWINGNENYNVGIGTTNPTSKLDVIGDVRVGIDTSQGVILTSPNGTKYRLVVDNSGNLSTSAV